MKVVPFRLPFDNVVFIEDSIFDSLTFPNGKGGAIYASSKDSCTLVRLHFASCSSDQGGGVAIEHSLISLSYSCFSSCRAKVQNEGGGNSFYTMNCTINADSVSSHMCAPDVNICGDAVFQMRHTEVHSIHTNFSFCKGKGGECSFGSIEARDSNVSYMNVVDCYEHNLYMLPESTLKFSNFLRNIGYMYFIDGDFGQMMIFYCCFFGNNDNSDGVVNELIYKDCFGDIVRKGINKLSDTITQKQTNLFANNCLRDACSCKNNKTRNIFKYLLCTFVIN